MAEPLKWAVPKTIFVNLMSDLFHEAVPELYIERVVRVMEVAEWHTYGTLRTWRTDWRREEHGGNWYFSEARGVEGWLCPALFKYFEHAPTRIYVQVKSKSLVQQ